MPKLDRNEPKRTWLRPRWALWLVLLALIGAGHYITLSLVLKGLLVPATTLDRRGWSAYYSPAEAQDSQTTTGLIPPGKALSADRGEKLVAFGLWTAPAAGRYAFNLSVRGTCELAVDGERLLDLEGYLGGQARADLSAGPHFLDVSLKPLPPNDASCRLEVLGPGEASRDLLTEGDLLGPPLANLETWWALASLANNNLLMVALVYAASVILVLLPLTLSGGWRSLAASSLIVVLPALAIPGPPGQDPLIGGPLISSLRAKQPDYVVIGNSYANAIIDSDLLGSLTGGKVEKLIYNGSETTIHYLMLKNILAASGVKPKATFVFTRDNSLTNPRLMVFPEAFDSLCPEREDPLVNQLVFGGRFWREKLRQALDDMIGVRAYRESLREWLPSLAENLTDLSGKMGWTGRDAKLRKHTNARFGLERLRAPVDTGQGEEPERWNADYDFDLYLDFDKVVETSFLPAMIELAKEHQLRLVFVRIQRRPPPPTGPPPQDPRLVRYVQKLRDYLAKQGVGFHDFTGDPELTQAMYTADDHMADTEGATRVFYQRLAWALK